MRASFVFLKALAVFLGTIIGVGIFGLPFVASKSGFLIACVYFVLMMLVVIATNWLYCKVVLGTESICRLPGYVGIYLSPFWKKFVFGVIFLGLTGSLLAYMIIGGEFVYFLLSPAFGFGPVFYTLLFFFSGAILVFLDIKFVAGIELFMLAVLLATLALFFTESVPHIDIANFQPIHLDSWFFPYGVVLFSLWGTAVVPEMKEMLSHSLGSGKKTERMMKALIVSGVVISSLVYLLFVISVLGASGAGTTEDAISGLQSVIGSYIIKLGFIFGIFACFTSFLTLGLTLKKVLRYDFLVPKNLAWVITFSLPILLFFLGMRRFIDIIGFVGAVAIGLEGIILVVLYKEFLKDKFNKKVNPAVYLLALVFVFGIFFEITRFFW